MNNEQLTKTKNHLSGSVHSLYATLVREMTDGFISLDMNNRISFCNRHICELLKANLNTLLNRGIDLLLDSKNDALFRKHCDEVHHNKSVKYELEFTSLDRRILPVKINHFPQYSKTNVSGSILIITDISAQKQLEHQLILSEKRFLDIAANTKDLIWEMDSKGRITYVNDMIEPILGYKAEEVIGKSLFELSMETNREQFKAHCERLLHEKAAVRSIQSEYQHRSGKGIHLEINSIPVFDADGNFSAHRGIGRDITEHKLFEMKHQHEQDYELQLEKCIVNITTELFQIEDFNVNVCKTLEAVAKTLKVCSVYIFRKMENKDRLEKIYQWNEGTDPNRPQRMRRIRISNIPIWYSDLRKYHIINVSNGARLSELLELEKKFLQQHDIVSFLAVPLWVENVFYGFLGFDNGRQMHVWTIIEIVALQTIANKISRAIEYKSAQKILQEQKMKFESVVNGSTEGIILLDKKLRINLINSAGQKILQCFYSRKTPVERIANLGDISISEIFIRLSNDDRTFIQEEVKATDGSDRLFMVTFSKLTEVSGVSSGMVLNFHEVTEIRKTQEQLMQSSKMASLGMLAAGIAHEMNNPLTIIIGHAQLLQMKSTQNDQLEVIVPIIEAGQRAKNIVENILEFSHSQKPVYKFIDINRTIHNTLSLLGKQLVIHNIALVEKFDTAIANVYGDQGQLQQLFLNIIQNACDAIIPTKKGGIIEIVTTQSSDRKIKIEINDNGPGMPEHVRKKVFDPFFTTKPHGKGTGLGLSICHKIVQKHDGEITVSSQPDRGTSFVIELPLKHVHSTDRKDYSKINPHELNGNIVIIDEDNKFSYIKEILKETKLRWIESPDIQGAQQKLCAGEYDVMLVDLKKLSAIDSNANENYNGEWRKKIIYMTDFPIGSNVQQMFGQKGVHWIHKSITADEFLEILANVLCTVEAPC